MGLVFRKHSIHITLIKEGKVGNGTNNYDIKYISL